MEESSRFDFSRDQRSAAQLTRFEDSRLSFVTAHHLGVSPFQDERRALQRMGNADRRERGKS